MKYERIREGRFLARPNRFIAHVLLDGERQVCHVKNTGRCRELLLPDARVLLQQTTNPARKTKYDLIAVWKGQRLINMDSAAPNQVVKEALEAGTLLPGVSFIRPECKHEDSRFDFYVERGKERAFIEVKGVTLEEQGIVRFPDAPTERGLRHLQGLIRCREQGYRAYVCFVVQMEGVRYFEANWDTHPTFGETLRQAAAAGVEIMAWDCQVTEDQLTLRQPVEIRL